MANSRFSSVAGERFEIIGAIHPGGAVELRAVVLQGLGDVRMRRRALEDHVFEQMRHARLAVAFVPRADEHGEIDRHLRLRVVRKEQHAQAVVELIFGDAFDGGHLARRGLLGGSGGEGDKQRGGERESDDWPGDARGAKCAGMRGFHGSSMKREQPGFKRQRPAQIHA